jgi:hypothetical protein
MFRRGAAGGEADVEEIWTLAPGVSACRAPHLQI